MKQEHRKTVIILTAFYGIFVLIILLGRVPQALYNSTLYWDYISRNVQFVPMKSISEMLRLALNCSASINARILAGINIIGNIGIMVPSGILFPLAIRQLRKTKVFILCIVIAVTLIEIIQLFATVGSFDIDDVVLNLLGSMVGYFALRLAGRWKQRQELEDNERKIIQ